MKKIQPYAFETFQKMRDKGVNIAMGTDLGFDPEMGTNAKELEIYVDLGMDNAEALQTTTINAARAIKLDKIIGSIEVGKIADLIMVNGQPDKDVKILQKKENIEIVMKEGKIEVDRRDGNNKSALSVIPGDWKIPDYL